MSIDAEPDTPKTLIFAPGAFVLIPRLPEESNLATSVPLVENAIVLALGEYTPYVGAVLDVGVKLLAVKVFAIVTGPAKDTLPDWVSVPVTDTFPENVAA